MGRHTQVIYTCEKCDKKLTGDNPLNIVTSLSENGLWSRLHVKIEHTYGMHNDGKTEQACLCHKCAVALLTDALNRVSSGERATAGTEDVYMKGWK